MFGAAKVSRMFRGSGGGAASFGIMFVVGYLLDPVSVLRASYRTDTTATKSNALQYRGRQSIGAPGAAADDDVIAHTPQYLIVGVPKSGTSVLYFGLCGEYVRHVLLHADSCPHCPDVPRAHVPLSLAHCPCRRVPNTQKSVLSYGQCTVGFTGVHPNIKCAAFVKVRIRDLH